MASAESFALGSGPHEEAAKLKILEVDGTLLQEILEELDKDDVAIGSSCSGTEYAVQPPEVHHPSPILEAPDAKQGPILVQDLDWLEDLMPLSEEVKIDWHGEEMVESMEFHCVVEDGNWEFYDRIASEDMGYSCLWENS